MKLRCLKIQHECKICVLTYSTCVVRAYERVLEASSGQKKALIRRRRRPEARPDHHSPLKNEEHRVVDPFRRVGGRGKAMAGRWGLAWAGVGGGGDAGEERVGR